MTDNRARLDTAERVHDAFAAWIAAADTKAGLVAAALSVLVGALVSQAGAVGALAGCDEVVASAARSYAWLTGALLLAAFIAVGAVVWPRVRYARPNPYAWPSVASCGSDAILHRLDDPAGRAEAAWDQAHILALICRVKHTAFRAAISLFGLSLLVFGAWGVLTATATNVCP